MSSFGSTTKSLLPHNQFICGGLDTFGTEECKITEGTLDMSKCVCKEVKESNLNLIEAYLLANEDVINKEDLAGFKVNHLLTRSFFAAWKRTSTSFQQRCNFITLWSTL